MSESVSITGKTVEDNEKTELQSIFADSQALDFTPQQSQFISTITSNYACIFSFMSQ